LGLPKTCFGGIRSRSCLGDLGLASFRCQSLLLDVLLSRLQIGTRGRLARRRGSCSEISICPGDIPLAAGGLKLGFSLLEFYLEICRVQLDKQIALMNGLIAIDVDLFNVRGDLRAYLRYVGLDRRVIRRFELSGIKPIGQACDHGNDKRSASNIKKLLALRRLDRGLGDIGFGRYLGYFRRCLSGPISIGDAAVRMPVRAV